MDGQDKTKAIVLKAIRYGDNSLVVRLLTEDSGVQAFMVKGAFNKNSKIRAALFQPATILDIVRSRSRNELGFLKEASLNYSYQSIPFEIKKNTILLFVSELLSKTIQESESDTDLFEYVLDALVFLDNTDNSYADFPLKFSIGLCSYLGFSPNLDDFKDGCVFNLEDGCFHHDSDGMTYIIDSQLSAIFFNLCKSNVQNDFGIGIKNSERRALLDSMMTYYKFHVAGFGEIKSCDILRTVLSSQ